MNYLIVDGGLSGTGIRDKYEGGYLSPESLGLNNSLVYQINTWLLKYENEHYNEFNNVNIIDELDKEGNEIARKIKDELIDIKVEYFSAARMTREII